MGKKLEKENHRRNKKRHANQKKRAQTKPADKVSQPELQEEEGPNVEVEYVTTNEIDESHPLWKPFEKVFEKLQLSDQKKKQEEAPVEQPTPEAEKEPKEDGEEDELEGIEDDDKPMSRKQRKKLKRLDVAQLKQLVARPDVVDIHDANAADPKLLVYLKAYRNAVPIPRHWSQKRKYLQGKRGIEKPPFQLPSFIADTGISRIREAFLAREEQKRARAKQRDKVQPKLHKIDIDYQVLHDAFFKYQTKPKMTGHGDLYFEGKEFEVKLPEQKHGQLSDRLKKALGMPDGAPPPWLINMQRYGPPPSYPHAKIPGLNAPIPPGASFGYHPGGWGKPPVDEHGMPLYGDVFNVEHGQGEFVDPADKRPWGEMEEGSSSDDDSDEDDDGPGDAATDAEGGITSTGAPPTGTTSETGESSTMLETSTGMETPDMVQIRKGAVRDEGPKQLFHVLDQQRVETARNQLVGSEYVYKMPPNRENVEVSLNPGEIENIENPEFQKERYNQAMAEQQEKEKEERSNYQTVLEKGKRKRDSDNKGKAHKQFKF